MACVDAVVDTAVELSAEYYKVFLELRNPTDSKVNIKDVALI
jgi:hypothetical protein